MDQIVTHLLAILGSAAIVGLIAIGLAISFRLMGVINFAHGTFIMAGAYTGVLTQTDWHLPWIPAVLLSVLAGAVIGAVSEVLLVRRLYRSPELSILGTFGLAIVLRQLAQLLFGPQFRLSDNPIPGPTSVLGVLYPSYKLLLIAIAVVVLFAVAATLQFTPLGVRVRAVAADNALAQTLGVRATRLNLIVFAASAALAALAGLLVAPVSTVSPTMGESYLFTAFIAVIVGGTRVWGVLVAALVIAAVENLATSWYDPIVARVAMLVLAFIALQWFRRTPVREAV